MNSPTAALRLVEKALQTGRSALSEHEAKRVLDHYEIPVTREVLIEDKARLDAALEQLGFPVVMKACSDEIAHKTEKDLIRLDLRSPEEAGRAYEDIRAAMNGTAGGVLVQEMVSGRRELVMGMVRDPQFGPCVMFGLGGIFTEILRDIAFRKAPLDIAEARRMMGEIRGRRIIEAVRGMPAADADMLAQMLVQLGRLALDIEAIAEIDINPVIVSGSRPVAVDALIVLRNSPES